MKPPIEELLDNVLSIVEDNCLEFLFEDGDKCRRELKDYLIQWLDYNTK